MGLNNLGNVQRDQEDYAAAGKTYKEALAIRRVEAAARVASYKSWEDKVEYFSWMIRRVRLDKVKMERQ